MATQSSFRSGCSVGDELAFDELPLETRLLALKVLSSKLRLYETIVQRHVVNLTVKDYSEDFNNRVRDVELSIRCR